jgi:secreted PhoX family phosphatase
VLLRWGDPILPGAPEFDFQHQTAAAQSMQFGYNGDYVAFFPLGAGAKESSTRGILAVNHEYTNPELMFTDYNPKAPTQTQVDVQHAAHGLALVACKKRPGKFSAGCILGCGFSAASLVNVASAQAAP